jgi:translation initiation factor 4B
LAKAAPQSGSGTTQVTIQKYQSWADECEEDEERKIETIQLPTAPRATRILEDNSIPQDPPFYARVSNLPFDMNEADVDEFFLEHKIHIKEMKLARDETNDRLRGFGHIEFETREDLIDAIMLADPTIRNRRLRIEVTTEPDMISGRTVRKRFESYIPRDSANESTSWRDRKASNFESIDRGDRDNRENRRNYQQRSNFQNRHDSNNNDDGGSNWRLGERPQDSPPERRRFGNDRRNDRGGRFERREPREALPEERPKLNIAPRTLPLPELNFPKEEELDVVTKKLAINGEQENHNDSGVAEEEEKEREPQKPKPAPVPKENIFGQAKPVDTTAREREIEEKLDQERQERIRIEKEKKEKEREISVDEEPRKDVIVIKTENLRRQDESTSWRKRDEPSTNGSSSDNKNRGPQNRQIGRSMLFHEFLNIKKNLFSNFIINIR